MNAASAIRTMRHARYIYPNSGFQRQLVEYDEMIWNEKRFSVMPLPLSCKTYRHKKSPATPRKNQSSSAFANGTINGKAIEALNGTTEVSQKKMA